MLLGSEYSDNRDKMGTYYKIISHQKHPLFNMKSQSYDIGLLTTEQPIKFISHKIMPICLIEQNARVIGRGLIAGYGKESSNEKKITQGLKAADVNLLPDSACSKLFSHGFKYFSHICAGYVSGMKDACIV